MQAFSTRLASEVAFTIMSSVSKSKDLMVLYNDLYLPAAVAVDSTEGSPDPVQQDEWLNARIRGVWPATTGTVWHPA